MRTAHFSVTLSARLILALACAAVACSQEPAAAAPVAQTAPAPAAAPVAPVATWTLGHGSIAGLPAGPGSGIALGQVLAAPAGQPAKLAFAPPLSGALTLSPGAELTLTVETVGAGRELVIELNAGAVQIDLHDKAGYAALRVRGAALDVRVTGTLFVIERVKRDADYVALVQGKLHVGLRKDVADALGRGQTFDIESRQGVGASTSGGLEQVASLSNRPQIASLAAHIRAQATAPPQGDGGWDLDLALDLLNDLLQHRGDPGFDEALARELTDALGEALFDDLHHGPGDQVIDTVLGSSPPGGGGGGVLSPPPPPPVN